MSRLNLSRKTGQGVEFYHSVSGKHSGLTVLGVKNGAVRMYFDGGHPFELHIGQFANLSDFQLTVMVTGFSKGTAKLSFEAPRTVRILRTELKALPQE